MPVSISAAVPEVGIECNEFAFLPGSREDKDGDAFKFLQEPLVSSSDERPGSLLSEKEMLSGATTPSEESSVKEMCMASSAACRSKKRVPPSVGRPVRLLLLAGAAGLSALGHSPTSIQNNLDDDSNYEFKPEGQEEYYDFLRGMGCDFPQATSHEDEFEDENQLEDEVDVEFSADGQEEYYDFLREMGVPIEERGPVDDDSEEEEEEEEEKEKEVKDWDGSEEWIEGKTSQPIGAAHARAVETNEMPASGVNSFEVGIMSRPSYDDEFTVVPKTPFRQPVSIVPGPSLCLQKALLNVAAERNRELSLPSVTTTASMERSRQIINRM